MSAEQVGPRAPELSAAGLRDISRRAPSRNPAGIPLCYFLAGAKRFLAAATQCGRLLFLSFLQAFNARVSFCARLGDLACPPAPEEPVPGVEPAAPPEEPGLGLEVETVYSIVALLRCPS